MALAARELGIDCVVFMPRGAAVPKVAATRAYGAEVRFAGKDLGEAIDAGQEKAAESGRLLIPPFDHPDIVTGQATLGLGILEQVPEVGTILVPTGGGGLLAGVAAAVRLSGSCARVIGVQTEGTAAFPPSLEQGKPVRLERMNTFADGIAVPQPSELTLGLVRQYVSEIRTVSEDQIGKAMLFLHERAKLVVEPSGTVGIETRGQEHREQIVAELQRLGYDVAFPAIVKP